MVRFDIITIFPEIFNSYLEESLLFRAQKNKLIKIGVYNLRKWANNRHQTVDDRPFGGGLGMVMKIEPVFKAVTALKKFQIPNHKSQINTKSQKNRNPKTKVILFTPRGKKFDQKIAARWSKLNQLIFICGRYEGVDERVAKHIADEEISLGDYVMMGGEVAAMVVIETVSRLIPEVVGKPSFLKERLTKKKEFIEYPQYTRPESFSPKKGVFWKTPKVLLSGNFKKINEWKKINGRKIGGKKRTDKQIEK